MKQLSLMDNFHNVKPKTATSFPSYFSNTSGVKTLITDTTENRWSCQWNFCKSEYSPHTSTSMFICHHKLFKSILLARSFSLPQMWFFSAHLSTLFAGSQDGHIWGGWAAVRLLSGSQVWFPTTAGNHHINAPKIHIQINVIKCFPLSLWNLLPFSFIWIAMWRRSSKREAGYNNNLQHPSPTQLFFVVLWQPTIVL